MCVKGIKILFIKRKQRKNKEKTKRKNKEKIKRIIDVKCVTKE